MTLRTVSLLLLGLALPAATVVQPAPARAQTAAAAAARDTQWWAPLVRHGWIEGGIGWLSAPSAVRRNFEAGQGFAAGIEARPRSAVRLRAGADYQILPALGRGLFVITGQTAFGDIVTDTVRFETRSAGWMGALRSEVAVRAPGGIWLAGGGGGARFDDGLDGLSENVTEDSQLRVRGAFRDGWGGFVTAGGTVPLEPALHAPIAVDTRWRRMWRDEDRFDFWTIRVVYWRP